MVDETKLLRCLQVGKLTFVDCKRLDREKDWPVWSIVTIQLLPDKEMLLIGGDFNKHIGEHSSRFEGFHGGNGYGVENRDGL